MQYSKLFIISAIRRYEDSSDLSVHSKSRLRFNRNECEVDVKIACSDFKRMPIKNRYWNATAANVLFENVIAYLIV